MVIPGHTPTGKTVISLPDEILDRASARANDLGLSRSEFSARAATDLTRDAALNVTTPATLNANDLGDRVEALPESPRYEVDRGLRRVPGL